METEKATSLRRGVSILMALASDEALDGEGLGVVRLAELVGSDKSRVSRTLRTLAQYELVDRDAESLAYRLGWALFALARRGADARLLHEGAQAAQQLVREFDEAAHVSVRLDVEVLTAVSRAPRRALKAAGWAGRTVPIHCTSAGRALLLDHDAAALERLLHGVELAVGGPRAPKDVASSDAGSHATGETASSRSTRSPSREWSPRRHRSATSPATSSRRSTSPRRSSGSMSGCRRRLSASRPWPMTSRGSWAGMSKRFPAGPVGRGVAETVRDRVSLDG